MAFLFVCEQLKKDEPRLIQYPCSVLLGSLSNDDGDGNENGKKSKRFMLAKQFHVFSRTTSTFFFFS